MHFYLIGEYFVSGMRDSIFELDNREITHADVTYFSFLLELQECVECLMMSYAGIWSMEEHKIEIVCLKIA